jgi:hypothetical protein
MRQVLEVTPQRLPAVVALRIRVPSERWGVPGSGSCCGSVLSFDRSGVVRQKVGCCVVAR